MDELPQPDIAQDPQAVVPVEPHLEPATLNEPEPAEPEAIITEALVDEPTSYFVGPMAESIKDFEPVDDADKEVEISEIVHGNANDISPEPHHEQNGEAAEYHRDDIVPTTSEIVPASENANVVLPEPTLEQREEPEVLHLDDAVPVATEHERQEEPQQTTERTPTPVPVSVPVPNYDMPSYPLNLGSEQEIWGGEHDHGAYPSSVPIVDTSSEDVKLVERSPAPSIRFVNFISFFLRIRS